MKYLTNSGLSYFLNKIKAYIASQLNSKANLTHTHSASDITSGLATVATSGSYNDLSNKPTIPSKTSDLTNDSGFLTSHQDLSGYVPRGGGTVLNGSSFSRNVNNSELQINGGTGWGQGASIALGGKDKTGNTGVVYLHAGDSTSFNQLEVCPNGEVKQNVNGTIKNIAMQEDVVPRSGGAVISGNTLGRINDTGLLFLNSGSKENNGGHIVLFSASYEWVAGRGAVRLNPALSSTTYKFMYLNPDGTWTWQGQAVQLVSDQRLKQQITEIDDALLDAWEDVDLVQFKYNDAVEQKGKDKARLHTGFVVQQIDTACKSHNVDISEYGLYCHEVYPEETEEVEVEQADGTKTKETKVIREASEHYSLRYTETLVVECAYLRKQIKELKERLEKLEDK